MTPAKTLGALGAAALLSISLTACGSGGGSSASAAPTNASKADFCSAFKNGGSAFDNIGDTDYSGAADAMHKVADKLKSVGTPAGIPADARKGFEVLVNSASNMSADKLQQSMKDMKSMGSGASGQAMAAKMLGISPGDLPKLVAFEKWAQTAC